ncbi:MAG TPA: ATP-binding protein [Desulfatiglandales bacterium]|nr:ATP-binding protein [Desulfatiglandales bacterium]
MKDERQSADERGSLRSGRPFLQPLAVALVCLIFVSLLFVMGLMNLKALDRALAGYMENRGLTILKDVRQVAEGYYRQLAQADQTFFDSQTGSSLTEEAFSLQESFIFDLTELAQEIDLKLETNRLSREQVTSFSTREHLWLIALLDEGGTITFETRPIPPEVLSFAGPVIAGSKGFRISIFNRSENKGGLGFIALHRRSGRGTLIMAFDEEGFGNRSARFSIERAIDEVGEGPGIAYLVMIDQRGGILGLPGESMESQKGELPTESPLPSAPGVRTRRIVSGNRNFLEFIAPMSIGSTYEGMMRLGLETDMVDQIHDKNRESIFISMGLMMVIAFLSMLLLYKNQNRYLGKMEEMQRRIHQAERLSALGRLAAGVAHEIRNPLNAISMAVQRLQRDNPHKLTEVIRGEIKRLNEIIEQVLSVSKSSNLEFTRHNATELLDQLAVLMGEEAESKGIQLKTHWDDSPLLVSMDLEKMKQALLNIMKNAIESISKEGSITLSARPIGNEKMSIRISDTGAGLSSEEIKHVFELDYTTKDKGLGLGLPLAHEIIQGHGGEIRVTSQPGLGTTFEILLPLHNP